MHFAGGLSLFSGGLLLMAVIVCKTLSLRFPAWIADILGVFGLGLVCLAGTPIPFIAVLFLVFSYVIWLILIRMPERFRKVSQRFAVVVLAWLVTMMAIECRFLIMPKIERVPDQFYIVGDSLSADIGGPNWPRILQQRWGMKIINLAQGGATAASAFPQAEKIPPDGKLVLVEIGGNDLLGGTPADEFARSLEKILVRLQGHPLVMFELPLYPWSREFGYHQRRLAQHYQVILIPKRRLAWVYSGNNTTTDGIHFSELGANRMADVVQNVLNLGNDR